MRGLVFAIEEMAVHDGPGLRTCIFLKGCPLRCQWCHNPEGWEMKPQRVKSPNGCMGCGKCKLPCVQTCRGCGGCLARCPRGLLRISGKWWEAQKLADRIHMSDMILMQGGVTVSGGEPLMQPDFLVELLDHLSPLHRCIETSGYADAAVFERVLSRLEMAFFDLKQMDDEKHRYYTGVSNAPVLRNLDILKQSGLPFTVRIPAMAGVNDDKANITAVARALENTKALQQVEILPYNTCAGAKYALMEKEYGYDFRQPDQEHLDMMQSVLKEYGIASTVRSQTAQKS